MRFAGVTTCKPREGKKAENTYMKVTEAAEAIRGGVMVGG